jgi:GDPmannose 4,6-dehydratase
MTCSGLCWRRPSDPFPNLAGMRDRVQLLQADILDQISLVRTLEACRPYEVYNLASPSFVPTSWEQPVLTAEFAASASRRCSRPFVWSSGIRFYQASSSEIYGDPLEAPQTEQTPVMPVTPYGVARRMATSSHAATGAATGFTPRRTSSTTTSRRGGPSTSFRGRSRTRRPASDSGSRRMCGLATSTRGAIGASPATTSVRCGSCSGSRCPTTTSLPRESHSVRELVETAFDRVGLDWRDHVRVDRELQRGAAELRNLVGDAAKARRRLYGSRPWASRELVNLFVDADLERLQAAPRVGTTGAEPTAASI